MRIRMSMGYRIIGKIPSSETWIKVPKEIQMAMAGPTWPSYRHLLCPKTEVALLPEAELEQLVGRADHRNH